ncbi:Xanthine/uracil/vitamin C permease [Beutenbergia cavernae DSM 12333]|uniref:Xanthine/uracil/vitamin C permease n=1 Tax=Beutenbergia cavernae (strain ATCC BAA-8 / DSM 12333 / CCUG 43141 / JCM 11478 / NBRC 16432 / NCIMB 13614 / HKI 0122) TaxID=471853 RepID=C5BZF3_BEUC1|nr:NCS2 family permease [Beutenbergia cavernae]ACQ79125.1 Xanthine/uracil/vitamin C permease [Beutenbergia cavernae DSM 12333]
MLRALVALSRQALPLLGLVTTTRAPEQTGVRGALDRYFLVSERGSTFGREIRGGLVTFFAMAYIIVLNPLILGTVPDDGFTGSFIGGDPELAIARVAATTALIAGLMSILMGVVAKFPLALAAGMGLNVVVTFSIATLPGMTWADAMGIVVLEGIIILVLVLTGFREAVFRAVPRELKTAIGVGIGLFIAFVGLVNAGIVRTPLSLGTPVDLGVGGSFAGWPMLVFVVGLVVSIVLYVRKVRGALLIAIGAATVLALVIQAFAGLGLRSVTTTADGLVAENDTGWMLNVPELSGSPVQTPDFGLLGQFSLFGSIEKIGLLTVVLLVFSLLLADFFDTMGTMVAVGGEAKLLDADGNPPKTRQILVVDSIAAVAGGAGSVSSNTSYVESAAGVGEGARTGLASVVTGVAFLLATFLAPLVELVPSEAATPALVLVGFLMMSQVAGISWTRLEVAIPAFLTIAVMPFTYSITAGIGAGFIAYVLVRVTQGKVREIHPLMWVAAAAFVLYFVRGPLTALL